MKRVNKILRLFLIITMLFTFVPNVRAAGSAKVSFSTSSTTVTLGSTVDVSLNVSNLSGIPLGINAIGSKINFDSDYLTLSKNTSLTTSPTSYSKKSSKIAFLSNSEDFNITENSGIIKFTFTADKLGKTTISTEGMEISDGKGDLVSVSDTSITLEIVEPVVLSNNANLSALSITGYSFNETFNKNTTTYTVTVPHTVGSVTINATPEDSKAKGVTNTGTKTLLAAGQTSTFTVTCTAEDGTTKKNYVVKITREAAPVTPVVQSSDNTLKNLSVDGYKMSPAFNKDTLNYEVNIPNDATEVIINADKNDSKAKVEIVGNKDLKVGENTVTVKVTAENGDVKLYTVKVNRAEETKEPVVELDSDATLKSLDAAGYTLSPKFSSSNSVYSINVGEKITGLDIKAIPNSDKAKVEIQGASGWQYGMNTVTIVVTAENGNKNTYILNVNRKNPNTTTTTKSLSQDNYLKSVSVEGTTINPGFDKNISNYSVLVPYEMSDLKLDYELSDKKAKVEVIGGKSLLVGEVTPVQIKVTAEDGSVRIYTLNVTRSAQTSKTSLKTLSAKDYTLSPSFDKDTLNYSLTVKNGTKSLDLTAIPEFENSKVEILGNSDFKVGKNTVLIKVTDENGFNKIYQIDVEREPWSFLGMSLMNYVLFFIIIGLIALALLIYALLRRKKEKEVPPVIVNQPVSEPQATPVIEFKPEFNFGSKNGTDDDIVYQGSMSQGNTLGTKEEPKKLIEEAHYEEANYSDDIYDETVTKTEIIEAIKEGMETKNPDKLKMLLKQDELNQLKKQVKENDERRMRRDKYDE